MLVMRKQKRRGNKKEKKKQRQTYVMCGKRGRGEGSQSLLREPGRRTMIRKRKMLVHVCMLQCVQLNTALMYLFCLVCLFFCLCCCSLVLGSGEAVTSLQQRSGAVGFFSTYTTSSHLDEGSVFEKPTRKTSNNTPLLSKSNKKKKKKKDSEPKTSFFFLVAPRHHRSRGRAVPQNVRFELSCKRTNRMTAWVSFLFFNIFISTEQQLAHC